MSKTFQMILSIPIIRNLDPRITSSEGVVVELDKRSSERSCVRSSDRATERASDRACDPTSERATDRATKLATERAVERPSGRSSERSCGRSIDRAIDPASDRASDGSSDRAKRLNDRASYRPNHTITRAAEVFLTCRLVRWTRLFKTRHTQDAQIRADIVAFPARRARNNCNTCGCAFLPSAGRYENCKP